MNDSNNIFALHQEAVEEQPKMFQSADGTKAWFLHGKMHREDGAAIEYADGTKEWWLHDKLHREDGAAIEYADGAKSWYLHDEWYETAEAWAEASLRLQNKPNDAASVDAFLKQILKQDVAQAL